MGAIVDNRMRVRVWAALLLDGQVGTRGWLERVFVLGSGAWIDWLVGGIRSGGRVGAGFGSMSRDRSTAVVRSTDPPRTNRSIHTHNTHTHTHTHTHTQHTQAPPPLPDVQGRKMDAEDARVVDADVKRTRWVVCCLFTH